MALLEPKVERIAPRGLAAEPRPRAGLGRGGDAGAAAQRPRRAARRGSRPDAGARPDPLRLRRQHVPPDPEGGRDGPRRRRRRKGFSPTRGAPGSRSRCAPAGRASTARRRATGSSSTCASTCARSTSPTAPSGSGSAAGRSSATSTACSPSTGESSAPTRRRPTSPASAASSPTTRAGCAAAWSATPTAPSARSRSCSRRGPRSTPLPTAPSERFAAAEPELAAGLAEIRDEIRADDELSERIRKKFEIKNTTGYRLCAFLDADTPLEIFRRLLVGSEGTLAFIAEATFETVAVPAADHVLVASLRRHRDARSASCPTSSPPGPARSS